MVQVMVQFMFFHLSLHHNLHHNLHHKINHNSKNHEKYNYVLYFRLIFSKITENHGDSLYFFIPLGALDGLGNASCLQGLVNYRFFFHYPPCDILSKPAVWPLDGSYERLPANEREPAPCNESGALQRKPAPCNESGALHVPEFYTKGAGALQRKRLVHGKP
jgi:hypothetical protein